MSPKTIRTVAGWAAVVAAVVGPFLPWVSRTSAAAMVRDLFFSGSEVASVGVMGAMFGGVLAATAAEPWRALSYLRRV